MADTKDLKIEDLKIYKTLMRVLKMVNHPGIGFISVSYYFLIRGSNGRRELYEVGEWRDEILLSKAIADGEKYGFEVLIKEPVAVLVKAGAYGEATRSVAISQNGDVVYDHNAEGRPTGEWAPARVAAVLGSRLVSVSATVKDDEIVFKTRHGEVCRVPVQFPAQPKEGVSH